MEVAVWKEVVWEEARVAVVLVEGVAWEGVA